MKEEIQNGEEKQKKKKHLEISLQTWSGFQEEKWPGRPRVALGTRYNARDAHTPSDACAS